MTDTPKVLMTAKQKIYRSVFFLSLLMNFLVCILVFTPLVNRLYSYLEVIPEIKQADSIILLSSGYFTKNIPEQNSFQRMLQAVSLYKEGYAKKIIICGGVLKKGDPPISVTIKDLMVKMGVNGDDIITEERSQNTYENLANSLPILDSLGLKKSLLVTSSYHMFRSLLICKKMGIEAYPAPVSCYEKEIYHIPNRIRFMPEIIREYLSIVYFWFKGWI